MPELRIILLVIGVLFVAGIAGFEWWRSRGQRSAAAARMPMRDDDLPASHRDEPRTTARENLRAPVREEPRLAPRAEAADDGTPRAGERGDIRPLPEINVVREPHMAVQDSLPVIELASTSDTGTRRALGISIADEVAVDAPEPVSASRGEPYIGQDDEVSEARVVDIPTVGAPKLVLAWPAEAERRIVTLRVMPKAEPRFLGRALRHAFGGCGFWHGPLDIYHLPDEQGRVLLSAAALAQPGTFDPSLMDSQRFSGVNLFAVLPGPAPEPQIFEELVHAARQLAERLGGVVTDQHGQELTADRVARLRQSLEAAAPAAQA